MDDTKGVYCWFFILEAYQHVAMVAIGGVGNWECKDMMITLSSHLLRTYSGFSSSLTTSDKADTIIWAELVPMEIDKEVHNRCNGSSTKSMSFVGIESLGEKKNKGEQHIWFGEVDIFDKD